MRELPMFPLGTVLFPHMVLPLHIFEPRYRSLVQDVLEGDREFGVTLIERGHEVGGGDERTDIGTIARIIQAEELDDGRWLLVTVGTSRFRVDAWLPDDPYPRALIQELEDDHDDVEVDARWQAVEPALRRILALRSELGEDGVPATMELSSDPSIECWQGAIVAPMGPLDAQRLLATDTCSTRLDTLAEVLDGLIETLTFRLENP